MKLKRVLCVILTLMLVSTAFVFPVSAVVYPESEHEYANDFYKRWYYYYGGDAKALLVTFSEETHTQKYAESIFVEATDAELTVNDVLSSSAWANRGDYITVYDGNYNIVGTYDGDELSGVTLFVPGNKFSVSLTTDESVTDYGFKVTNVEACPEDKICNVTYHPCVDGYTDYSRICYKDDTAYYIENEIYNNGYIYKDNCAFAGWSTTLNGGVNYDAGDEITDLSNDIDLYAVWVKQILNSDEVCWFNNSSYYFVQEGGTKGYYLSEQDAKNLQLNLYKIYGVGPLPGPVLSIVLATYPNWEWQGSCYGFSVVTALQHFGKINVLPMQNADNMGEMELDDNFKSYINYYQAQAATSWLCENKAYITDTAMYKQSLKDMYSSVCSGNIVIFSFYSGSAFVSAGHTILLTGAYDDADGNHIITVYDCNCPYEFRYGDYGNRIMISADYSEIDYSEADSIGAINWTDDFSQFEAFDIKGEGEASVWYNTYFNHISEFFTRLLNAIKALFTF